MRTNHEIFEDLVLAEASAWLARLQGPRMAAEEAAFKAWLTEDSAHARAFARVTETWDIIPGAAQSNVAVVRPARRVRRIHLALAASLIMALMAGGLTFYARRHPVYQTRVGEQRTVMLSDGSRVTLNTDTKITVVYSKAERRIVLDHGEALFDDVTSPGRPFIVKTGGTQIRALGTVFDVRSTPNVLEVTLVKGKVAVSSARFDGAGAQSGKATVLSPGERLTLRPGGKPTLGHSNLDAATAWERGEAMFDNAPLHEVTAELNRYGGTHIRLGDPSLGQLRVSGVFTTRDPVEAAKAIAKLCGLNVERSGRDVVVMR